MRLIFAGTPQAALPSLDALVASSHEVVAVITRPDAARGRGRTVRESPVAARATEHGIRVLRPTSLRDTDFVETFVSLAPDCCPVVAYGQLIPKELLSVPPHGWVNLHFSLLPMWRGAAPVQHALLHGDEVTGATTFRLTEGLDSGPVFGTVTEVIGRRDTSGDVLDRLAASGAALLVHTLDAIESGEAVPHEQSTEGVSLAPKLTPEDARVRWSDPALAVDRRIRACTPAPGAWTRHGDRRLGILPLGRSEGSPPSVGELSPGELGVTKHAVWVGTGSHAVLLDQVKPEGKGTMDAADWARGVRITDGERLT
ncbi:MAG TPA: methionyl-tRNA formyltransferase [Actinomycetes bacterium]|nr:methionyl-tRNA formyltransferase [Actinomycetes bacterium]